MWEEPIQLFLDNSECASCEDDGDKEVATEGGVAQDFDEERRGVVYVNDGECALECGDEDNERAVEIHADEAGPFVHLD